MTGSEQKSKKAVFKPFPGKFLVSGQTVAGSVLDLNPIGMLVEVGNANLHAGERLEFSAELPPIGKQINNHIPKQIRAPVLVIKVYNRVKSVVDKSDPLAALNGPKTMTVRLVEAHFLQPSPDTLHLIEKFLHAAQRKT